MINLRRTFLQFGCSSIQKLKDKVPDLKSVETFQMKMTKPKDKSILPEFEYLDLNFVANEAKLSINLHVNSPFRWTPLIQLVEPSEEFLRKMRYFQRLQFFEEKHRDELIDTFIFEALKGTTFDYYYDYVCKSSAGCPYHGVINYLLYNKENDKKLPIIPIIKVERQSAKTPIFKERQLNNAQAISIAHWTAINMYSADNNINTAKVIQTNGNIWRIIELSLDGDFKKSGVYSPQNRYEKIYFDPEMQKIALGIIKYSLNQPTENEKALKYIYDFVDERRYLTEQTSESTELHKNRIRFWKFLPERLRNFFFN